MTKYTYFEYLKAVAIIDSLLNELNNPEKEIFLERILLEDNKNDDPGLLFTSSELDRKSINNLSLMYCSFRRGLGLDFPPVAQFIMNESTCEVIYGQKNSTKTYTNWRTALLFFIKEITKVTDAL